MIDKLLENAQQALNTARLALASGDTNGSVNRSYYAVYYAVWAVFAFRGLDKPKSHSGMISEFSRRFVKDGSFDAATASGFGKLENLRSYADYALEDVPKDKARFALATAEAFLAKVKACVAGN